MIPYVRGHRDTGEGEIPSLFCCLTLYSIGTEKTELRNREEHRRGASDSRSDIE